MNTKDSIVEIFKLFYIRESMSVNISLYITIINTKVRVTDINYIVK